jgi:hypothetical protein
MKPFAGGTYPNGGRCRQERSDPLVVIKLGLSYNLCGAQNDRLSFRLREI